MCLGGRFRKDLGRVRGASEGKQRHRQMAETPGSGLSRPQRPLAVDSAGLSDEDGVPGRS